MGPNETVATKEATVYPQHTHLVTKCWVHIWAAATAGSKAGSVDLTVQRCKPAHMTAWVTGASPTYQLRTTNIWLTNSRVYFPTITVRPVWNAIVTHLFWLHLQLLWSHSSSPLSVKSASSLSIVWSADTRIIGLASKPHLDKLCGTCGGMLHCTVIRKRKCKTHETWKGCNYCLRAVVRWRKVYFVLVVTDISFTPSWLGFTTSVSFSCMLM